MIKPELLNGANLAFIGDAYYELYIRKYLIDKQITNQNLLHKLAVKYVSAKGHNKIVIGLMDQFTEAELVIFKRGRNHSSGANRKKLSEYLSSSGFEAVIGYLYLTKQEERLHQLIDKAIRIIEEENE
ncbi:MAG TPA: ribonuclease III domain-containing protein [Bacilli bacterium]|jgi:ribonuclease-3 family protein|nr:Mini-ribonuclease 3 [Acholeplasmataceae bacterium]HNZ77208.1 ribonuclease III domain-containing protein [Bacilli bacterium]HOH61505.1 ribonuclease III domain-containing protein [Bacilli bacterium]HPB49428.1 ribonuclease III domain-containing protein [Bacilli bacterium]HPM14403.1 ribonuclease III domain-containing protein [Bacilli bacterium]